MNNSKITIKELKQIATNKNLKNYSNLNKKDLIKHIGGEGFLSSLKSYIPTFRSKNSPKIGLNNSISINGIGYNSSNLEPKKKKTELKTRLINSKPITIPLDIAVTNVKNNNVNKTNKLKQILNMNSNDVTIYFSKDAIKKLIDFELKLIKDNIDNIEKIKIISSIIRYDELLKLNKDTIDKIIININTSNLMRGFNFKLIQLSAILVNNLKDLKKLVIIKNLKNNTSQKNINSFSSKELKNYIKKISSNITPTSNMKTIQRKMKIRSNLQGRLNKIPKQNTKGVAFRNKNGVTSLTNIKLIPTRFE
jgi:hypothetical protein